MSDKKKFNTTFIPLWTNKSGNVTSMPLDARAMDQFMEATEGLELGGRFIVKQLSNEARSKFKNPDNAPTHFLEFMSKETVENFKKGREDKNGSGAL